MKTYFIGLLFCLVVFGCGGGGGGGGGENDSTPSNIAPSADAGPNQSFIFHNPDPPPVTLNGTANDSDGTIVSHQWIQTGGPAVTLSGADTPTATFSLPDPLATQAYTFSYTITDNSGAQATDSVSIYATKIIYSDSFDDAFNWTFEDDTADGFYWIPVNGELRQQDSALAFQDSYQLGTYAVLSSASLSESSYRFSVDVTPLRNNIDGETEGNDVGIMFRYQDGSKNYYRLSMNARSGYTRLEKHEGGTFSTLAVNAIGYVDGQPMTLTAEVNGDVIVIWIDGDPIFAVVDASISSGTVALYCQDKVKFDNVLITEPPLQPTVVISTPLAYSIALTPEDGATLTAEAVVLNPPSGSRVGFFLDNDIERIATLSGDTYSVVYPTVVDGEHDIMAILRDANGAEVSSDINSTVGTGGDYYLAVGDSITRGFRDEDGSNNDSADGRIVANQGFQAPLADNLTATTGLPQIVFNEGIGGLEASELLDRMDSILLRHPGANKVLLLIGTNDSDPNSGDGSGVSASEFATSVGDIATKIDDTYGKQVWIAEILPTNVDPARNTIIQDYNDEIRIIPDGDATFLGPDLYTDFIGKSSLYTDLPAPQRPRIPGHGG